LDVCLNSGCYPQTILVSSVEIRYHPVPCYGAIYNLKIYINAVNSKGLDARKK
jgi:hypothetical protein